MAIDTDKIVAYHLTKKLGNLHIWFEGVADSVVITYNEIGEDNFCTLVKLLQAEFTDIDKLNIDQ